MACDDNKKGCKSNFECLDKLDYCLNLPNNEGILNFKCDRNIYGDISTDNIESSGVCTKNHHYIKDVSNTCQKDGDYYRCIKDDTKFKQGLVQVCENGNWSEGTRCNDKYKVCADDEGNCMHCSIETCTNAEYQSTGQTTVNTKNYQGELAFQCIDNNGLKMEVPGLLCENKYECMADQLHCGTCNSNKNVAMTCKDIEIDGHQVGRLTSKEVCVEGVMTILYCKDENGNYLSCDTSSDGFPKECGKCLNGASECKKTTRYYYKHECKDGIWDPTKTCYTDASCTKPCTTN
jgi:hypothetical protein